MNSIFYGFWNYWELRHKVTFDGPRKIILVNNGVTELNVKTDIYSDWKEWLLLEGNAIWSQALRSVGGDPTTEGQALGATFFLMNGWHMQTWNGNHRLIVTGNIYTEDATAIFIPVTGPFTIEVSMTISNLIDITNISVPTTAQIVTAVLDELLSSHTTAGTVGQAISAIKAKSDNLPGGVMRNTPLLNFTFTLFSSSDHITPITGRSVTAQRSLDGAAFAACSNGATEIGYGVYKINLTAADTNADMLALRFTAAGADPCNVTILTEPI